MLAFASVVSQLSGGPRICLARMSEELFWLRSSFRGVTGSALATSKSTSAATTVASAGRIVDEPPMCARRDVPSLPLPR